MTRTLVVAAACGLAASAALAQAPPAPPGAPAAGTSPAATNATASPEIITRPASDEWLASNLKGTVVIGTDNRRIGEVTDALVDGSGQIRAFIVTVAIAPGGGSKDIAIDLSAFQRTMSAGGKSAELKVPLSQEQVSQAQQFQGIPSATTSGANPARPANGSPGNSRRTTAPRR